MLVVENLSVVVSATEQPVCEGLSFKLEKGMCVGVLGSNGTGKTTLLHALAGLLPFHGSVHLAGKPLQDWQDTQRARHLAVLLQQRVYHFPITVEEALLASRYAYSEPFFKSTQHIDKALQVWGLAEKRQQFVASLSGGELQRLALAMVSAQGSDLVLLDEPANNLDLRYHQTVVDTFGKGTAYASLVVLHDVLLAQKMCSHMLLLKEGRWRFGEVADLCQPEHLAWVYSMDTQHFDFM